MNQLDDFLLAAADKREDVATSGSRRRVSSTATSQLLSCLCRELVGAASSYLIETYAITAGLVMEYQLELTKVDVKHQNSVRCKSRSHHNFASIR